LIGGGYGTTGTIVIEENEMNEPQVLTPKRTEEGKRMRKDYEAHKVSAQRKEMQQLEPRGDGISNTLTTAQKDNYLIEPSNTAPALTCGCETTHARIEEKMESITFKGKQIHEGDGLYLGTSERFMRDGLKDCSRALKAGIDDAGVMHNYRIRKLTEREAFRLMGVKDEDSDKIREVVSKSQCYKLAGNSIVVDVMVYMFDQLFFGNKNANQQLELF
jgi:site-specific DNA-cytosine methylase